MVFFEVAYWFLRRGEHRSPGEKSLSAEKVSNKLNPYKTPSQGIEPELHWWEASALTTAPFLLTDFVAVTSKYGWNVK